MKSMYAYMCTYTLPKTNIAPEKSWSEDDPFLLGQKAYLQFRTVSFRKGIILSMIIYLLFVSYYLYYNIIYILDSLLRYACYHLFLSDFIIVSSMEK